MIASSTKIRKKDDQTMTVSNLISLVRHSRKTVVNVTILFFFAFILKSFIWPILMLTSLQSYNYSPYIQKGNYSTSLIRRREWAEEQLPEFCTENFKFPKPCRYSSSSRICSNDSNQRTMFSRSHLDYYIFTRHFGKLKSPGIYVDIAANHPIEGSSTYFFDRCLGWSGLCIEPNSEYFQPIVQERSCALVPTCINSQEGSEVQFNFKGELGGILSKQYKFIKNKHALNNVKQLRCTTLAKLCDQYGIRNINYMSVDVEGHELDVLKGFNFTQTIVQIISVESGPNDVNVQTFLEKKGYARLDITSSNEERHTVERFMGYDMLFKHRSVKFGFPQ